MFEDWLDSAKSSTLKNPAQSFCHDCTAEYKALMMKRGLCSRPDTVFAYVLPSDKAEDDVSECGLSPETYAQLEQMGRIRHGEDDG